MFPSRMKLTFLIGKILFNQRNKIEIRRQHQLLIAAPSNGNISQQFVQEVTATSGWSATLLWCCP